MTKVVIHKLYKKKNYHVLLCIHNTIDYIYYILYIINGNTDDIKYVFKMFHTYVLTEN